MRNDVLFFVVGWTLLLFSGPLILMTLISLWLDVGDFQIVASFAVPFFVCVVIGYWMRNWGERSAGFEQIRDREAFAAVALGWPIVVALGAMPYWLSGTFHGPAGLLAGDSSLQEAMGGYVRAWFESMSGFTTTGATVIDPRTSPVCHAGVTDCINAQSKTILLWRSFSQWLGGMGIIMLGMLMFSRILGGGMSIARAELTGPSLARLKPRIEETARVLWLIYILMTLAEFLLLLFIGDLGWFDSINHAMTTLPSGGFSTYDDGIMHFDSAAVEWIIIMFMVMTGVNFSLYHFIWVGEWRKAISDQELRVYLSLLFLAGSAMALNLIMSQGWFAGDSFRHAAFQVASIGTSTGYASADFAMWPTLSQIILLFLMIVGACAGSTSGGLKILRLRVAYHLAKREVSRIAQPRKIHLVRMNDEVVDDGKLWMIVGMLSWWAVLAMTCTLGMAISEPNMDLETVLAAVVACLGNTGPALGSLGPTQTWASLNWFSLIMSSILMWLGRLELLTVIVLLTPKVWRK